MKRKYDISDFIPVVTIESIREGLVERFKKRRKELHLTQRELSLKSGVSYGSIRRFESTGDISLYSLLSIANSINCLEDFNELFKNQIIKSLKEGK